MTEKLYIAVAVWRGIATNASARLTYDEARADLKRFFANGFSEADDAVIFIVDAKTQEVIATEHCYFEVTEDIGEPPELGENDDD